jgi:hypothetical protein
MCWRDLDGLSTVLVTIHCGLKSPVYRLSVGANSARTRAISPNALTWVSVFYPRPDSVFPH